MNDVTRQIFALLSFIVGGAILALLVGHAQQTTQLLQGGLGGFNTLLNTIENPQGATTGLGSTLSSIGSTLTGIGNLGAGVTNLTNSLGGSSSGFTLATGTSVPGGTDFGGGSDVTAGPVMGG